jgi:hypothetical protein
MFMGVTDLQCVGRRGAGSREPGLLAMNINDPNRKHGEK